MKYIKRLPIFLILLSIYTSCHDSEKSNINLLSNQNPTDSALIFGESVISTDAYEFAITFNPEMSELYFTRRKPGKENEIYSMKLIDDKWSKPELAFFSTNKGWDFEPHINPKGNLLYFGSTRPLNDTIESSGLYQWYSKKNVSGWSKPIPLEKPFMDKSIIMYLTSSENGNLYFTTGEKGDKPEDWVIYNSINEKGQYKSIKRMGKEINSYGKWIAHSYIAPDESYMIYDFKNSELGNSDLYISFNKSGNWTEALILGPEVNTDQTEMCASVSPDGKYLFFHRGGEDNGDIYWIDFRPIKEKLEISSSK